MITKVYTILKSSYNKEDNNAFVENLFFANVSSIDALRVWFRKIILATDVKKVWITDKEDDTNLFYVEYNQDYEADFYHGFSVQILNFSNHEQYVLTKEKDKVMLGTIKSILSELLREKNQMR